MDVKSTNCPQLGKNLQKAILGDHVLKKGELLLTQDLLYHSSSPLMQH